MIPGVDVIVAAVTVAVFVAGCVGFVAGIARLLRPEPQVLADPWVLDVDLALRLVEGALARHPTHLRAAVVVSGVSIVLRQVVHVGDESAWSTWRVWVGEHSMESPTLEGALDIARYRLQAIADQRAERAAARAVSR